MIRRMIKNKNKRRLVNFVSSNKNIKEDTNQTKTLKVENKTNNNQNLSEVKSL